MATHYALTAADQTALQGYTWPLDDPQAVLVLIHGHGEHLGRYEHFGQVLNQQQIAILGADLMGHGQSKGKRGDFSSYDAALEVIDTLLQQARSQYPDKPIFLMGHSMGGNLVAAYVLRRDPQLSGIILSAPWLELAFAPSPVDLFLAKMMLNLWPSFTQSSKLDANALSQDPAVVQAYQKDPLVHDKVSPRLFTSVTAAGQEVLRRAPEWSLPLLVYHGDADRITSHAASQRFAKAAGGGQVTWHSWPGGYHEMHHEPNQQEVLDLLGNWISKQFSMADD